MFYRFCFGSCALLLLAAGPLQAQPVPEGPEWAFYSAYLAQAVGPAAAFDADGDLAAMLVGGPSTSTPACAVGLPAKDRSPGC